MLISLVLADIHIKQYLMGIEIMAKFTVHIKVIIRASTILHRHNEIIALFL